MLKPLVRASISLLTNEYVFELEIRVVFEIREIE